ncbi:oxidoreductase [Jiangella alkaliphila]|uniref:NAD(P)-dependent dehydrogenase, short-chain alcohol dehydrogenase family n=1 Tax=Jiangella alkaliphila TaxID=419479 RepID=A0A1H2LUF3_9ACTN|nr:oxidoreductase [Jiangella alkaliphila]SDU84355.1 NAD(P)-dependent dehydrogenase, short-chain alcohol dehydrogenase family [Jiangella alkaliphila]
MSTPWTTDSVGDLAGRTAVVTGANTGIGREVAAVLAAHGATVVLACRDVAKAEAAASRLTGPRTPDVVAPDVVALDLGDLASVRAAAARIRERYPRLDLLVNNAGVMWLPRQRTADGFERHLGVNHLGHFALTGLLLDRLLGTPGSRVVTLSSNGHKSGRLELDDLHFERRRYRPTAAYTQSKLANLLFTYELQRRLEAAGAAGAATIAVAAHPGGSRTDLMRHSPPQIRIATSRPFYRLLPWLIQDAAHGALPPLRAALDPAVRGGDYYGPDGWGEWTGSPVQVTSSPASHDAASQRGLWAESERLTGVEYDFTPRSPAVPSGSGHPA